MIKRSISMPVKPRYIEETPHLERSEEKEELNFDDDESENGKPFLDDFVSPARDNQSRESSRDSIHKSMFYLSDASDISETATSSDEQNKPKSTEETDDAKKSPS